MRRYLSRRRWLTIAIVAMTGLGLTMPNLLAKSLGRGHHHHEHENGPKSNLPQATARIQLAILLDTSSSMSGLIHQAREHLWTIVNTFSECHVDDGDPTLEVSLFEYGNSGLTQSNGFIRQITPFTQDLDLLSEHLFSLTTNGGSEHCGEVIEEALHHLAWNPSKKTYRAIFIAGNEPFTQGTVPWNQSCRKAAGSGVLVNTIFCGDHEEGIRTSWKDGAMMTDGSYLNIDHNHKSTYVKAPQDERISNLSLELNDTYIHYGKRGKAKKERQRRQDSLSKETSISSFLDRAASKSSRHYQNSAWDLVDANDKDQVEFDDELRQTLSPELQAKNDEELKAHVVAMADKRKKIQGEILSLQTERKSWLAQQKGNNDSEGLGHAIIKAMKEQATDKGIQF
jgi:hypothetical protein